MNIETLRMIERLIAVMLGGMSMFLGYRLFVLGVTMPQNGDVDLAGKLKIRAKAFAPGIFFAAFGTLIVGYSFTSRVTRDALAASQTEIGARPQNATNAAGAMQTLSTRFNGFETNSLTQPMNEADARHLIREINRVIKNRVVVSTREGRQLQAYLNQVKKALLPLAVSGTPADVTAYLERLEGRTSSPLSPEHQNMIDEIYNATAYN